MTAKSISAILLSEETGLWVRKGKAMLQIYTDSSRRINHRFDLQGTFMPAADKAEWLICVCLYMTGSSGCLGPGDAVRIRR